MKNETFTLTKDNEFITLDNLLKFLGLVGSGGEAHAMIQKGKVKVNNEVELQKRKKIRVSDEVQFNDQHIEIKA